MMIYLWTFKFVLNSLGRYEKVICYSFQNKYQHIGAAEGFLMEGCKSCMLNFLWQTVKYTSILPPKIIAAWMLPFRNGVMLISSRLKQASFCCNIFLRRYFWWVPYFQMALEAWTHNNNKCLIIIIILITSVYIWRMVILYFYFKLYLFQKLLMQFQLARFVASAWPNGVVSWVVATITRL